jgi:hypothetical protein
METQTPDLAQHANMTATSATADKAKRGDDPRAEEAELEQLEDRISAARSVY